MSRIKRNAVYYTDPKNQNFWCKLCYAQLASQDFILLDDGSEITKSKLLSEKHDSLPEESFLECHDCKGRVHQVCALVNGRKVNARDIFRCPKCILVHRSADNEPPKPSKESANQLPRCKMSDSMEEGLLRALDRAYEKVALEIGIDVSEVEKAEGLSIRIMSHVQKKHAVRDEVSLCVVGFCSGGCPMCLPNLHFFDLTRQMYKKYSKHGCPASFPVHTKCVGLFQSVFGVDILLFAMYVYEYGHDSPAPNRRRVYISYLDSVKYFEPKRYRTVAYQAVIMEYLRFVKRRGFHTAHIWSCPPAPGDEYVFHCHPSHQKVPKESMLRQWYYDILKEAQRDGIVVETTDFYEEYFKNGGANSPLGAAPDPMSLPYFEGDYIPGEIENIVANVNKEEQGGKQPSFRDMVPSFSKRTTSGLRSGTRSNPGQLVNQVQDKVMNRLGIAIFNMKENLIIARLRSKSFAAAVERGDDVSEWPDEDEESRPEIHGKDPSSLGGWTAIHKEHGHSGDDVEVPATVDGIDEIAPALTRHFARLNRSSGGLAIAVPNRIGSTVDEDDEFESEMFESRQLFLNYCQANHLQFDEIRRAKHTTMMVLYQLHNPSVPKFVPRCGACQRDIGCGSSRYHCVMCTNFDLCEDCYRPVVTEAWSHRGSRFRHDGTHTFSRISAAQTPSKKDGSATSGQEQRTRALQAYLEVLTHAAQCDGPPQCQLQNCAKMKHLFVHVTTCETTHSAGCRICARLLALIVVHARSCSVRGGGCPLPYCDKIRERNERLRQQQLFMDDRRRQAQNAFYRAGDAA
jgi:E1A/CREB-binding protein